MKEQALPRIRCTEELRKAVEKSAREDGRTVSNWMLRAITEKLEREGK